MMSAPQTGVARLLHTRERFPLTLGEPTSGFVSQRRIRGFTVIGAIAAVIAIRLEEEALTFTSSSLCSLRRRATARFLGSHAGVRRHASMLDEPLYSEEAWSDDVPSSIMVQDLEVGREMAGIVVKVAPFGIFVDVGADKQGLVHISQLSTDFVPDINTFAKPGESVTVWVHRILEQGRLDLTMIAPVSAEKAEANLAKFEHVPADQWLDGSVTGTSNFGAYVNILEPGGTEVVQGIVHISQIADGFVEHPAEVVQPGQQVKVRILEVKEGKLRLSMRELVEGSFQPPDSQDVSDFVGMSPSVWLAGKVSHARHYGIFVDVHPPQGGASVQGLVHISEIREGFVDDSALDVDTGQEVKVRVISVEPELGRVSLSMRPMLANGS